MDIGKGLRIFILSIHHPETISLAFQVTLFYNDEYMKECSYIHGIIRENGAAHN
jgi:hypothetical protein